MSDKLTPDIMWRDRADQVRQDVRRVDLLLRKIGELHPDLSGSFTQVTNRLQAERAKLTAEHVVQLERWANLSAVQRECRAMFELPLELLGGLALGRGVAPGEGAMDGGIAARAESLLDYLCKRLKMQREPVVIPGRGALLVGAEHELDIARAPFLDHELWSLPLLARVIGLWSAADDQSRQLRPAIDQLVRKENQPTIGQAYFADLFADMLATVVLGPAYPMAVFVLELDFANPQRYRTQERSRLDRGPDPCTLPTSTERAAAMMATLQEMNERTELGYVKAIKRLEELWQATVQTFGSPDSLAGVRAYNRNQHRELFGVIGNTFRDQLSTTLRTWRRAEEWFAFLSDQNKPRPQFEPSQGTDLVAELLSAMWWHRLHFPPQAPNVHAAVLDVLNDVTQINAFGGSKASLETLVVDARLDRLRGRWMQLEHILKQQLEQEDRAAVAGRFYQLISRQWYAVDQCRAQLAARNVEQTKTSLDDAETRAQALQREAIEYLGGLLIRNHDLDLQPELPVSDLPAGPSICRLADRILDDCARRTGVNWNARTVFGLDPFLEPDTDVIRVRFPDWSPWSLPLMAHEFGHVVARVTPQLRWCQSEAERDALQKHLDSNEVAHHLEELFCDIFATYTLGPAFACSAIVLQFNPLEAWSPRDAHPTHQERVEVILQTLDAMSQKTHDRVYDTVGAILRQAWTDSVADCAAGGTNDQALTGRLESFTKPWGRTLAMVIDQSFRLGAQYTVDRWSRAQELAKRLPVRDLPEHELHQIARTTALVDLLNALWWARVFLAGTPVDVERLTQVSYTLGNLDLA